MRAIIGRKPYWYAPWIECVSAIQYSVLFPPIMIGTSLISPD